VKQRSTQLALLLIVVLTTFSVLAVWPSDPDRYLPDFVPWPKEACVGPICMGKGVNLPYIGFDQSTLASKRLERREMQLGLDLRGGTRLVLEADISENPDVNLDEALDSAVEVVERRVNAFGVAESITERVGNNRISVQLPGITAEEAIEKIGRTAQLQFMELQRDANGNVIVNNPDGTTQAVPFELVVASNNYNQNAVWTPRPRPTPTASAGKSRAPTWTVAGSS
jgi:preprotein translocase subunit SecD